MASATKHPRTEYVGLKFSVKEINLIDKWALRLGITRSAWIREQCFPRRRRAKKKSTRRDPNSWAGQGNIE